nr:MAG TPA: hypothetical protein [Caudoviricetes sp.]
MLKVCSESKFVLIFLCHVIYMFVLKIDSSKLFLRLS